MLYLAVEYNDNKLNAINIIGLAICLDWYSLSLCSEILYITKYNKNYDILNFPSTIKFALFFV